MKKNWLKNKFKDAKDGVQLYWYNTGLIDKAMPAFAALNLYETIVHLSENNFQSALDDALFATIFTFVTHYTYDKIKQKHGNDAKPPEPNQPT